MIYLYKECNPTLIRKQSNCRNPRLNDLGQIVWKEHDVDFMDDIFFYNGSNSSNIGGPGAMPDINNDGKIVWVGTTGGGVILYDNNTPISIIPDGSAPRINNAGQIVYENGKICLYDNGNITEIADNAYISYPDINNNGQIVWAGYDGAHYRIYLAQPTTFPPPIVPLVPGDFLPITSLLLND